MSHAPRKSPMKSRANPSSLAERLVATHSREREAFARLEAELMTPEAARVVASGDGSTLRDPFGAGELDDNDSPLGEGDEDGGDDLGAILTESDLGTEYSAEADGADGRGDGSRSYGTDTKASDLRVDDILVDDIIDDDTITGDTAASVYMRDTAAAKANDNLLEGTLVADSPDKNLTSAERNSTPRYLMQTQTSINRERTVAENSLRIVRRQQQRSEKARTELVLRKSKLDSELSRAQKALRESKAKQHILRTENQSMRAQITTLERDAEQLRGAMVHQATVNRNAQTSAKRRLAKAEERLKAAQERADSVAVRNDTLLEASRLQANLAQQVAKLEDDKNKLMASLAKARRRLTEERAENSEMTRLRYDLELAKAEGKFPVPAHPNAPVQPHILLCSHLEVAQSLSSEKNPSTQHAISNEQTQLWAGNSRPPKRSCVMPRCDRRV